MSKLLGGINSGRERLNQEEHSGRVEWGKERSVIKVIGDSHPSAELGRDEEV